MLLSATTAAKGSGSILILIYFVIFGLFYFFYLRPRSKKQKAARQEAKHVEIGARAQTIGGLVGTIVQRTDDLVTIRTASGVDLDFVPNAIARRLDEVSPAIDRAATPEEGDDR